MKKIILPAILMLMTSTGAFAQMGLYKAEEFNNSQKYKEADEEVMKVITSGELKPKNEAWAYNMAGNIKSQIFNVELMKVAQGQPCDTTVFINYLNDAMDLFVKSHKVDVAPNEKGKVKPKFVENNRKMVGQMLTYFAYAGQFQNENKDYKGAYKSFVKCLDMPKCGIWTAAEVDSIYKSGAKTYDAISYYASMLAFQQKDWDGVLNYSDMALGDSKNAEDVYMMKLQAYLAKKDTASWVKCSKEAIKACPANANYCQNLLYYYTLKNLKNESMEAANELVHAAPTNAMAWYAKGCVEMSTFEKYVEARVSFQKAIDLNQELMEANFNMGVCFINEIVNRKDEFCTDQRKPEYKKDREYVLGYYKKALPFIEKARELSPSKPNIWASHLKNLYYNLEMKDKLAEIDNVMKSM